MAATRATYLPTLTSTVGSVNQTDLNTSAFSGGVRTTSETQSWSGGLDAAALEGAAAATSSSGPTTATRPARPTRPCNPCFSSGLQAQITQPILRNRAIDNTARDDPDQRDQPGHRRAEPERHAKCEHPRAGAQRVLGAGLRAAGRRGGAAVARTRDEAGRRQPRARRDRHHGPDRHRAGAGRRGEPAAAAGDRAGHAAQQRAGAEAADRQRHRRRSVARDHRADGPPDRHRAAARPRGGGPHGAHATGPTSR